jgi:hypothetical protein
MGIPVTYFKTSKPEWPTVGDHADGLTGRPSCWYPWWILEGHGA